MAEMMNNQENEMHEEANDLVQFANPVPSPMQSPDRRELPQASTRRMEAAKMAMCRISGTFNAIRHRLTITAKGLFGMEAGSVRLELDGRARVKKGF